MKQAGDTGEKSLALFLLGCSAEPPRSVLLITVDTLRADHVSASDAGSPATPHIASETPVLSASVAMTLSFLRW